MYRRALPLLCLALTLNACAGRDPRPVQTAQATDMELSCPTIDAEIQRMSFEAQRLYGEQSSDNVGNVALGVVGVALFWPALFAMDLSDADKIEADALMARANYLSNLRIQKGCGVRARARSEPRGGTAVLLQSVERPSQ